MRITRETLLKTARDQADLRARLDRSVLTICLVGSLLSEDPLIGGVTDIDLVVIHNSPPDQERELQRLTDEIHLDITHQPQSLYHQPRQLRVDPWLGPAIYANPILLHDSQHWFEFASASVRSQFLRPDYVLERAQQFAGPARQDWLDLRDREGGGSSPVDLLGEYLRAVENAANAVASLSGPPLSLRRLLLEFPQKAQAVGNPELYGRLLNLIGAGLVDADAARAWLPAWGEAFSAACHLPSASPRLHPLRKLYYERAFEALLGGETPQSAILPLLITWTSSLEALHGAPSYLSPWMEACQQLRLHPEERETSLCALDEFLDSVEEILDRWAEENGVGL